MQIRIVRRKYFGIHLYLEQCSEPRDIYFSKAAPSEHLSSSSRLPLWKAQLPQQPPVFIIIIIKSLLLFFFWKIQVYKLCVRQCVRQTALEKSNEYELFLVFLWRKLFCYSPSLFFAVPGYTFVFYNLAYRKQ